MVTPIQERDLDIHYRITSQRTALRRLADSFFHCRYILTRNRAALDGVDKLKTLSRRLGLHPEFDMPVLPAPTGLTNELPLLFYCPADGLFIGDLRLADVGPDIELPEQTVDNNLQVEFSHPGYDGLSGLFIGADPEGGILGSQFLQRKAKLLLVGFALRFNGNGNNGFRKIDRFQNNRVVLIAERVAGGCGSQPNGGGNVSCVDLFNLLAFVRVHL